MIEGSINTPLADALIDEQSSEEHWEASNAILSHRPKCVDLLQKYGKKWVNYPERIFFPVGWLKAREFKMSFRDATTEINLLNPIFVEQRPLSITLKCSTAHPDRSSIRLFIANQSDNYVLFNNQAAVQHWETAKEDSGYYNSRSLTMKDAEDFAKIMEELAKKYKSSK